MQVIPLYTALLITLKAHLKQNLTVLLSEKSGADGKLPKLKSGNRASV